LGTSALYFAGKGVRDDAGAEDRGAQIRREALNGMAHRLTGEGSRWETVAETAPSAVTRLQAVRPDPDPSETLVDDDEDTNGP